MQSLMRGGGMLPLGDDDLHTYDLYFLPWRLLFKGFRQHTLVFTDSDEKNRCQDKDWEGRGGRGGGV